MTHRFWASPALVMGGAVVLLLAGGAAWISAEQTREVGGVVVREPLSVPGTAFAPVAVVLALAALGGGVLLAAVRGPARRLVGAAVVVIGVAALVAVLLGAMDATAERMGVTAAPFAGGIGALAVVMGGATAVRGAPRPPSASRYRVGDERSADDEWSLASDDGDDAT